MAVFPLDRLSQKIEIITSSPLSDMFARLNQIDVEIADVERLISSKNQTIISALAKGTDTLDEENEVGVLNKALQLKKGARRKLMSELGISAGAAQANQA
jgi:hypothetical protein